MSRKKRKCGHGSKNDVQVESVVQEFVVIQTSKCYVCNNVDDEDMTVLCDGHGCGREVHMYCLDPVMTELPIGDWLCDFCSLHGSTISLLNYFKQREYVCKRPSNIRYYSIWLESLASRYSLNTNLHDLQKPMITSFNEDLIGLCVTLLTNDDLNKYHRGRIIDLRQDSIVTACWEVLVQFTSGGDGRNQAVSQWICLDEHACFILDDFVLMRNSDYPTWTPALRCLQSPLHQAYRAQHQQLHNGVSSYQSTNNHSSKTLGNQDLFFVLVDETLVDIRSSDISNCVIPYESKVRNAVRPTLGKKLSLAAAFVTTELEERRIVRHRYKNTAKELVGGTTSTDCETAAAESEFHITTHDLYKLAEYSTKHVQTESLRDLTSSADYLTLGFHDNRSQSVHAIECVTDNAINPADPNNNLEKKNDDLLLNDPCNSVQLRPNDDKSVDVMAVCITVMNELLDSVSRSASLNTPLNLQPSEGTPCIVPDECPTADHYMDILGHILQDSTQSLSLMERVGLRYKQQLDEQQVIRDEQRKREREVQEEKKRAKQDLARKMRDARLASKTEECVSSASRLDSSSSLVDEDFIIEGSVNGRSLRRYLRHSDYENVDKEALDSLIAGCYTREFNESGRINGNVDNNNIVYTKRSRRQMSKMHEDIQNMAAAQENASTLLTDLERKQWPGTVVVDVPSSDIGRVIYFESGWCIVRGLHGVFRSRPYQLEVLSADSEVYLNFEDAEVLLIDTESSSDMNSTLPTVETASVEQLDSSASQSVHAVDVDDDPLHLLMTLDGDFDNNGEVEGISHAADYIQVNGTYGDDIATECNGDPDLLTFTTNPFAEHYYYEDEYDGMSDTEYDNDCFSADGDNDNGNNANTEKGETCKAPEDSTRLVKTPAPQQQQNDESRRCLTKYVESVPLKHASKRVRRFNVDTPQRSGGLVSSQGVNSNGHSSSVFLKDRIPQSRYISFNNTKLGTIARRNRDNNIAVTSSSSSLSSQAIHPKKGQEILARNGSSGETTAVSAVGSAPKTGVNNDRRSSVEEVLGGGKYEKHIQLLQERRVPSDLTASQCYTTSPPVVETQVQGTHKPRMKTIILEDGERLEVIDHRDSDDDDCNYGSIHNEMAPQISSVDVVMESLLVSSRQVPADATTVKSTANRTTGNPQYVSKVEKYGSVTSEKPAVKSSTPSDVARQSAYYNKARVPFNDTASASRRYMPNVHRRNHHSSAISVNRKPSTQVSSKPTILPPPSMPSKISIMDEDFNLVEVDVSTHKRPHMSDDAPQQKQSQSQDVNMSHGTSTSTRRLNQCNANDDNLYQNNCNLSQPIPADKIIANPHTISENVKDVVDDEELQYEQYEALQRYQQEQLKLHGSISVHQQTVVDRDVVDYVGGDHSSTRVPAYNGGSHDRRSRFEPIKHASGSLLTDTVNCRMTERQSSVDCTTNSSNGIVRYIQDNQMQHAHNNADITTAVWDTVNPEILLNTDVLRKQGRLETQYHFSHETQRLAPDTHNVILAVQSDSDVQSVEKDATIRAQDMEMEARQRLEQAEMAARRAVELKSRRHEEKLQRLRAEQEEGEELEIDDSDSDDDPDREQSNAVNGSVQPLQEGDSNRHCEPMMIGDSTLQNGQNHRFLADVIGESQQCNPTPCWVSVPVEALHADLQQVSKGVLMPMIATDGQYYHENRSHVVHPYQFAMPEMQYFDNLQQSQQCVFVSPGDFSQAVYVVDSTGQFVALDAANLYQSISPQQQQEEDPRHIQQLCHQQYQSTNYLNALPLEQFQQQHQHQQQHQQQQFHSQSQYQVVSNGDEYLMNSRPPQQQHRLQCETASSRRYENIQPNDNSRYFKSVNSTNSMNYSRNYVPRQQSNQRQHNHNQNSNVARKRSANY